MWLLLVRWGNNIGGGGGGIPKKGLFGFFFYMAFGVLFSGVLFVKDLGAIPRRQSQWEGRPFYISTGLKYSPALSAALI